MQLLPFLETGGGGVVRSCAAKPSASFLKVGCTKFGCSSKVGCTASCICKPTKGSVCNSCDYNVADCTGTNENTI